jgi:hypothetical protein
MPRALRLTLSLIFTLLVARNAHAVCGDVTGDGKPTATDALAVLRVAVGQPSNLVCAGEGPSRLRYYNDFSCNSGSSLSQAKINGLTFEADAATFSDYQTTALTELTDIEIDLCASVYAFTGPVHLPPDRSLTFLMVLLDPAVYQFPGVNVPAYFIMTDDGTDASALVSGAPMSPAGATQVLFGGTRR